MCVIRGVFIKIVLVNQLGTFHDPCRGLDMYESVIIDNNH